MANISLVDFYQSKINDLREITKELANDDCDGPFLMCDPPRKFVDGKRVLIIGQETNTWHGGCRYIGDSESIIEAVKVYSDFNFGEKYNSTFFQYARIMVKGLCCGEDNHPYMWSNVFKFGRKEGKGKPASRIIDLENDRFNVLKDEIKILKPDCVVFFTGPNYDNFIRQKLHGVEFQTIDGTSLRKLAKLKSVWLPVPSYRIYHPSFGNRHREEYKKIFNIIKDDFIKENQSI